MDCRQYLFGLFCLEVKACVGGRTDPENESTALRLCVLRLLLWNLRFVDTTRQARGMYSHDRKFTATIESAATIQPRSKVLPSSAYPPSWLSAGRRSEHQGRRSARGLWHENVKGRSQSRSALQYTIVPRARVLVIHGVRTPVAPSSKNCGTNKTSFLEFLCNYGTIYSTDT